MTVVLPENIVLKDNILRNIDNHFRSCDKYLNCFEWMASSTATKPFWGIIQELVETKCLRFLRSMELSS